MPISLARRISCMLPASMGRSSYANGRRALAALALGSLLLGPLPGLSGCAKIEARDLIREGNTLYKDAKFPEAIEKYDAAEQLEPDGVTLFWNRACAAESQVLRMKEPEQREERRKYADMALRDFQTWYDRLDIKTAEDAKQLLDHRLNVLNADERCDDLLTYWFEKQREDPKNEAIYGAIIRQYEQCGDDAKVADWYVKRTEDFPESVKAWHALAIRKFEPLWPDPESGLQYNDQLPPVERLKIADEVLRLLDKAVALDPKFRDAYVWRSMAYTQRQFARVVIDAPELPEEKIEAILAREDAMLAWKQQKAVCDLDQMPDCPTDPKAVIEGPCCPPPPLTPAAQAEDAALRAQVEAEMKAALEPPPEETGKGKKDKGGKKKAG
jgi:tetratricopeptide (TPR) repeat protein